MKLAISIFLFLSYVVASQPGESEDFNKIAPLNVGEVTNPINLPACPTGKGFRANATCTSVDISCENTVPTTAVYSILEPCTAFKGTITLLSGGSGTSAFDNGYVDIYLRAGFRVIQMAFVTGWNPAGVGRQNLKYSACRPATLYRYLFETVHHADLSHGFCAHGHSGGAAALGYTMTWYGGDDFMDYVLMSAGPIFSNVTAACIYPYAEDVRVCPEGQNYCGQTCESFIGEPSFKNTRPACTLTELTGYPCVCPTDGPSSQEAIEWWDSQNMVSPKAQSRFQFTGLSSWLCKPPTTNVHTGQAQHFAKHIRALNGHSEYLISSCAGAESVWNGVFSPTGESGLVYSSRVMIESCTPKHKDCTNSNSKYCKDFLDELH